MNSSVFSQCPVSSKYNMLKQCCLDAETSPKTMAEHQTNISIASFVEWVDYHTSFCLPKQFDIFRVRAETKSQLTNNRHFGT